MVVDDGGQSVRVPIHQGDGCGHLEYRQEDCLPGSRPGYLRHRSIPADSLANTADVIRLDFENQINTPPQ